MAALVSLTCGSIRGRSTRAGRSMSMHATMSVTDGVVDPVIASQATLQIGRASRGGDPGLQERRATRGWRYTLFQTRADGGPGAYTIADGTVVVKAYWP